ILVLLTGICPLIGWRKASVSNLRRNFLRPAATAVLAGVIMAISGIREPYALLAFTLASFVGATIVQEYITAIRARKKLTGESSPLAGLKLIWRMRRRYGGHIVHFGLALMVVGIAASSVYKLESQGTLKKGETLAIGDFVLEYENFRIYEKYNRTVYAARLGVFKEGVRIDEIEAERRNYINAKQPTTEVSIRSTLLEDLYVTMPGIGKGEEITLKVAVNPLLIWIWIGSCLMVFGGILAIIPSRRRLT
ncbi:MAG: hypothetical protein L3J63_10165, partial [Geopsychrobacter sp.]|nr:hypothetical protein [Geopsychrobacter sp.]